MFGGDVLGCGDIERLFFFRSALLLQVAEFEDFLFAAAREARFLNVEIAELFLIREEGLELDHAEADGMVVFPKRIRELEGAFGEERHLESGDAMEAPGAISYGLHQIGLTAADGLELLLAEKSK
jgi:hypothetical protein